MTDKKMWRSQGDFHSDITRMAEKIFGHLDEKLEPRLFVLGVPIRGAIGRAEASLEPEGESGYKPEFFSMVTKLAEKFDEEEAARRPGARPAPQGDEVRQPTGNSIRRAVKEILAKSGEERGVISFCSEPMTFDDLRLCCVLQLNREVYDSYHRLPERNAGSIRLPTSLIDAAAAELLVACAKAMRERNPGGDGNSISRGYEEILRAAARELMSRAAYAGSAPILSTFDSLNTISSLGYEGEKAAGEILVVSRSHPDLDKQINFETDIELEEFRTVRKMLELATEELPLLSGGYVVYGLGNLRSGYDKRYSEVFRIRFTGHYAWELWHEGDPMMKVSYGMPSLPKKSAEERFKDHVGRLFDGVSPEAVNKLWELVEKAEKQPRGTMIVLSNAAQSEARRLAGQSTAIKPITLNPNNILKLTSIDGAILIDVSGTCYALGVILDGQALEGMGTRERGARYNSAIRYIESARAKGHQCLAVILSEDKTVDLYPKLPPRVSRSKIEQAMAKLRSVSEVAALNKKVYYRNMNWLSSHRVYLSPSQCAEINEIQAKMLPRLKETGTWTIYEEFKCEKELDDSYYID
jgi:hypothetical protein